MEKNKKLRLARFLRNFARYTLLSIGILLFVFALLSGAEKLGGGLSGIIKNSPNALPWVILLTILFVAWKRELTGGMLLVLSGLALFGYIVFVHSRFNVPIVILSLIPIFFGGLFITSWYLSKKE